MGRFGGYGHVAHWGGGDTVYVGIPANSLRIPENGAHVWPEEDEKRAGSRQVENSWTPESRGDIQEEIVLPRGMVTTRSTPLDSLWT